MILLSTSSIEQVQENENCVCTSMFMIKNPEMSGPFNAYFEGKRRLWEGRWQIRVKRTNDERTA